MAEDKQTSGAATRGQDHLLEENRLLAQRYLELENNTRRQLEKLRAANELLTKGEAHMRLLLENSAIGFALLDLNMRVVSSNRALSEMLGYSQAELSVENFNNYVYVGKLPAFSRLVSQAQGPVRSRETIELVGKDGRLLPCRMAASDWLDDTGGVRGTFLLIFSAKEEVEAVNRLRVLEETTAELGKSRSIFMDVVSRELRTPARGIMGMVRMLLDAGLTDRQAELAGVIHSSASSLVRLVDDLVDLVKIDAGDLHAHNVPFNPVEVVEGMANLFGVRAEEKGLELRVNIGQGIPGVALGDANRIRRVLAHLLDNAVKFTSKGRVAISVDVIGDTLRFMVSDTAGGIDAPPGTDILAYTPPVDSPASRRLGGIGIGLPLCKRLVRVMGGRLAYETEPGRGSEFHFSIPLAFPEGKDHGERLQPPLEALRLPPMSILLADANPLSRRMVRAYLQFDGHNLTVVENGLEAAEMCRSGVFNLAILDMQLPKLDGLQTLRLIRDDETATGRPRLPVLMMVTHTQARNPDLYTRAGAEGVLKKPVQPVDLMAAAAAATRIKPVAVARQRVGRPYAAERSGSTIRRINGEQLVNLRQVMLDDEFLGILRFFMEDAVFGIIGLVEMGSAGTPDMERVAFTASKHRGLAGYLGLSSLADLLQRIETAGRNRVPPSEMHALVDELPVVVDDTLEELKRILPEAFATLSAMSPTPAEDTEAGDKGAGEDIESDLS